MNSTDDSSPDCGPCRLAGARLQGLSVCVPRLTLVNERGQRVDLVGMAHLGSRAFYRDTQTFVDAREAAGAVVQYERIYGLVENEEDHPLVAECAVLHPSCGLCCQYGIGGLDIGPRWLNTDLSGVEYYRLAYGSGNLEYRWTLAKQVAAVIRCRRTPELLENFEECCLTGTRERPENLLLEEVNIDYRNRLALRAIREVVLGGQDVVALWGAAHLKGLTAGLAALGFGETARVWRPYWIIQSPKLVARLATPPPVLGPIR